MLKTRNAGIRITTSSVNTTRFSSRLCSRLPEASPSSWFRPTRIALTPPLAAHNVVNAAMDANNPPDWSRRFVTIDSTSSRMDSRFGSRRKKISATLSGEYPGSRLTIETTSISIGNSAVMMNSVAFPEYTSIFVSK